MTPMYPPDPTRYLLIAALLSGCAASTDTPEGELGGQFGEEMPVPCAESRLELTPDDEVEELGISAAQAWAWLEPTRTAPLQWTEPLEERVDELEIAAAPGEGAPVWLVRDPWEGTPEEDCTDGLLLPAVVTLRSLDGLLDEALELELRLLEADRADFDLAVTPDAIAGDLAEALSGEGESAPTLWLLIAGQLDDQAGTEGYLSQVLEGPDPDAAGSEPIPLGSWSGP